MSARLAHGNGTFVGFGFGAIQAGLFCLEAQQSGAFARLVVAEVAPELVADVRRAGGVYQVNVAHNDRREVVTVGPIAIENPAVEADRSRLIAAIVAAQEIATAVPSVRHYTESGPAGLHRILAEGLRRKAASGGPAAVVYAAENHPRAAALLQAAVMDEIPAAERAAVNARVRFVDTVIAKMSGVVQPPGDLAPVTPGSNRAFLVEAFNHILISRISFGPEAGFVRGIQVFEEKEDLHPFEEAKLYGHNAVHALAAYLGAMLGVETLAELAQAPGALAFLRDALVHESGGALLRKYAGIGDPFFTAEGFAQAANDLLARMANPFLRDTVARVGRDPARKLGWDDRLVGAMRLALAHGITPRRYAVGAAAALYALDPRAEPAQRLPALWQPARPDPIEMETILALIAQGRSRLAAWCAAGHPDLAQWLS